LGLGLRLVLHLLFDHPGYRAPDVVQVGFQNLFQVVEDIIHDPVEEGFEGGAGGWAAGHGNYSTLGRRIDFMQRVQTYSVRRPSVNPSQVWLPRMQVVNSSQIHVSHSQTTA
jgi:hypothetical protein